MAHIHFLFLFISPFFFVLIRVLLSSMVKNNNNTQHKILAPIVNFSWEKKAFSYSHCKFCFPLKSMIICQNNKEHTKYFTVSETYNMKTIWRWFRGGFQSQNHKEMKKAILPPPWLTTIMKISHLNDSFVVTLPVEPHT